MGSNILRKHISFKKIVAGPRVNVSSQNKKIIVARPPDPTPSKGDAGSLTIVAYDTGPLVGVSRQTARAAQNFPPILTIMPMEFQLLHRAVKGMPVVSLNTVTRAVHIRLLARQIHNARILPTAAATRPAHLRRSLPARRRRSLPTAALLFSSPTTPYVTTVTRTWLLVCGRTSSQPRLMRIRRRCQQSRRRAGRLRPRADVDPAPPTITRTSTSFATEVSPP
jgi:hypothetical protein